MRITNKKQLTPGKTYYYFTSCDPPRVHLFNVTKVGNKYLYASRVSREIDDVLKGMWFDNEDEAQQAVTLARKILKVRRVFFWKYEQMLTTEECVEFYDRFGDRVEEL
jgi:hypothetical protein